MNERLLLQVIPIASDTAGNSINSYHLVRRQFQIYFIPGQLFKVFTSYKTKATCTFYILQLENYKHTFCKSHFITNHNSNQVYYLV